MFIAVTPAVNLDQLSLSTGEDFDALLFLKKTKLSTRIDI